LGVGEKGGQFLVTTITKMTTINDDLGRALFLLHPLLYAFYGVGYALPRDFSGIRLILSSRRTTDDGDALRILKYRGLTNVPLIAEEITAGPALP